MVTQTGFCATTLRQLSPRVERPDALSPSGCLLSMYTAAPSPYIWHALDRLCRTMQLLCQYSSSTPANKGAAISDGQTGHATSQDAVSALTYHRILRCNSRCSQETQLTEPRILAPMGCPYRCDRPAASLSTVRKGRPPLRAQTLIPQLHALLQGLLPASHQRWGPFRCRSFDTDVISVRQCRLSLTRLPLPQTVSTIFRSRSPLQGLLSYKKERSHCPPAVTAHYRYIELGPSACSGLCSDL